MKIKDASIAEETAWSVGLGNADSADVLMEIYKKGSNTTLESGSMRSDKYIQSTNFQWLRNIQKTSSIVKHLRKYSIVYKK